MRHKEDHIQDAVDIIEGCLKTCGLQCGPEKFELLVIGARTRGRPPSYVAPDPHAFFKDSRSRTLTNFESLDYMYIRTGPALLPYLGCRTQSPSLLTSSDRVNSVRKNHRNDALAQYVEATKYPARSAFPICATDHKGTALATATIVAKRADTAEDAAIALVFKATEDPIVVFTESQTVARNCLNHPADSGCFVAHIVTASLGILLRANAVLSKQAGILSFLNDVVKAVISAGVLLGA
ncbi:hypothetical protein HPB52_002513 [Rhipicephalus sanguineus]|uniref:Uncharacterized protein n=1 Tax=Rhipicephalus sanguineus TaxID=34632 RepID=A0A9D4SNG5_RHISA|nr:hypothetical protein HPB52_002513 [Rhipicephalus sanguineus]